jgi:hypothetical protein
MYIIEGTRFLLALYETLRVLRLLKEKQLSQIDVMRFLHYCAAQNKTKKIMSTSNFTPRWRVTPF